MFHTSVRKPQYKEPSARSELAVIQPLWPSVDLQIYKKILIRVLESQRYWISIFVESDSRTRSAISYLLVLVGLCNQRHQTSELFHLSSFSNLSSLFSKEFTVGAETTASSRLFQSFKTLCGFPELEVAGFLVEFVSIPPEVCSERWSEEQSGINFLFFPETIL